MLVRKSKHSSWGKWFWKDVCMKLLLIVTQMLLPHLICGTFIKKKKKDDQEEMEFGGKKKTTFNAQDSLNFIPGTTQKIKRGKLIKT